MPTRQDALDRANPNDLPSQLSALQDKTNSLGLGAMLGALRPRNRTRGSLASSATQVHDQASIIYAVQTPVGTPLSQISGGSPGAGEVSVDYDATTGVPTLVFSGAVTTYTVHESGPLPQNLVTQLAATQ